MGVYATTTFAGNAAGRRQVDCPPAEKSRAVGFDPVRLCEALQGFADPKVNFHGLVVERHGAVVAQAYRRGRDKSIYSLIAWPTDFDGATRHDLRSVSKSVTSLLWGIAQAQGNTPPLSAPVLDLLPDMKALKGQGRETITVAHLFTMSSGLQWNEPSSYTAGNDEFGLYWRSSQPRYVFDRPMAAPAGAHFNYNGGSTAILAQILAERTGMTLPDFARRYLFEPLGIEDWEWLRDVRGRPLAFAGLRMRPADLARIGRMILQHGQWQGKQVVPAAWLEESLRPHIETGDGLQYGYQWWMGKVNALGVSHSWRAGFGNGGQRLFMVPGLDLVVVMTSGEYGNPEIGPAESQLLKKIAGAATQ